MQQNTVLILTKMLNYGFHLLCFLTTLAFDGIVRRKRK